MRHRIPYARTPFSRLASTVSHWMGHPRAFIVAVGVILAWCVTGPLFGWSDTWQLVINTTTTIVTFLMVFLIQNTQNRESRALHIKVDELIRTVKGAQNALLDLEELTDEELIKIREQYIKLAHKARGEMKKGFEDTGNG
jgi:low affinity Fe/Cu permease